MIKLDTTKRHIITITDTGTGESYSYECGTDPRESIKTTMKTIRSMQGGKVIPRFQADYAKFMKTPAERFSFTVTQHFNFQFGVVYPPHILKQIRNTQEQRKAANRIIDTKSQVCYN